MNEHEYYLEFCKATNGKAVSESHYISALTDELKHEAELWKSEGKRWSLTTAMYDVAGRMIQWYDDRPDVAWDNLSDWIMSHRRAYAWVAVLRREHDCGYPSRRGKGDPRWKYGEVPVSAISSDDVRKLRGAK
jgi:hypothetical protein